MEGLLFWPDLSGNTINATFGTYDGMGRLTGAGYPDPTSEQPNGGSYSYDWVGNRLTPPAGASQMVYNKADQLVEWESRYTYTYYYDGSLKEVKTPDGQIL